MMIFLNEIYTNSCANGTFFVCNLKKYSSSILFCHETLPFFAPATGHVLFSDGYKASLARKKVYVDLWPPAQFLACGCLY